MAPDMPESMCTRRYVHEHSCTYWNRAIGRPKAALRLACASAKAGATWRQGTRAGVEALCYITLSRSHSPTRSPIMTDVR